MPEQIIDVLRSYRDQLESVAAHHIEKVILYGSYARGDNRKDSDIDIMILVNLDDYKDCEDKIYDLTYDFNMGHGTEIMPIVQNVDTFNYWKDASMFYRNIDQEGVYIG